MIEQLFEWSDWDILASDLHQFYGCKLKQKIGNHDVGDIIKFVEVDYYNCKMNFYDEDGKIGSFNLKLSAHNVRG